VFFTQPISLIILIAAALLVFVPMILRRYRDRTAVATEAPAT
jgi:TctA family transporter